jgi:RimJ/RimL family protein N-acetyltransferase
MTSTFPEISISTDRLMLRHFEEEDVPALVEMMNDELVQAWTSAPHPYTEQDARAWVVHGAPARRTEGQGIAFAVTEHLTQRLVGRVEVRQADWRLRTAELSVVTAPWARGEGYAPEAVTGVAQWLFEDQKFERLELRTAAGDIAAQRVAQKIGCISEGVLRSAWLVRGAEPRADDRPSEVLSRTDLLLWGLLPEDLEGLHESERDGLAREEYATWTDL